MNFEPQKFFIGVIDFFSILLPGALLTYLLKDYAGPLSLGDGYYRITDAEGWAVFIFTSYLLGHFIFLIGSWLDDLYDAIRTATYTNQINLLSDGRKLAPKWTRWLAEIYFKKEGNQAVKLAVKIREHYLGPLQAMSAINAFQWCKARLTLEHPEAMAVVQRFEADSKFFRSLLVVLCIILPWGLLAGRPLVSLVSVPVLLLAFWRYLDQRLKATNQAYWFVIALESQSDKGFRQEPQAPVNNFPTLVVWSLSI